MSEKKRPPEPETEPPAPPEAGDEPSVILKNTPEQRAAARQKAEARREQVEKGGGGGGAALRERIVATLKTIKDPEIPVDLWELGLIYGLDVDEAKGAIAVRMTLTSPNCPVAEQLPVDVKKAVEKVEGVKNAQVDLVWEPPWTRDMMSEAASLQLGMF